jgi:DNA polymerase-3 subunit epsilon
MSLPIHVVDFEGNRQLGIGEWGVVSLDGQEILETQTQLCPPFFLPDEVPPNCVDFGKNVSYFLQLRRSGILCSHSRHVEDALLRHYWASPGYVPSFTSDTKVMTWGPWLDSCAIWMHLSPGLASYGLMDLIQYASLQEHLQQEASLHCPPGRSRPHAALYDALAASLLLRLAIRLAPQKTLEDWIFYSSHRGLQELTMG